MRLVPPSDPFQFGGPSGSFRPQFGGEGSEFRPPGCRPGRWLVVGERLGRPRRRLQPIENLRRGRRPNPLQNLQDSESGDAVARIFGKPQHRQHVLDVRGVEELEPAELDERNVPPRQLDLQLPAVVRGAEEHRLLLERRAALAIGENAFDDVVRLAGLVGDDHQRRLVARGAVRP